VNNAQALRMFVDTVFDHLGNSLVMQGRSRMDRELLDAGEVSGHLVPAGSMFAFLAEHRGELFPDSFIADLFSSRTGHRPGRRTWLGRCWYSRSS
jgi:hypothetical protein